MRNFKILIVLALLAASSPFAAVGKFITGAKASASAAPFVGFDRPFHVGLTYNDTGVTIAQSDTLLFFTNTSRGLFKSSDFNANMLATNAVPNSNPYAGWVETRKDSLVCYLSFLNEDNDSATVTTTINQLDHGTVMYPASATSSTVLSYDATARLRVTAPLGYSNQYSLKLLNTTATDTLRVYRVACGDK